MQSPQTADKTATHLEKQQKQSTDYLTKLLTENEFKRLLIAKKISTLEKKIDAQIRRSHLNDFLSSRTTENASGKIQSPIGIFIKSQKSSKISQSAILAELKIRQEILEYENALLKSKLKAMTHAK